MVFKSGYRRLPKELIDYIWKYDNRYKLLFKNCVYELNHYFHKHRLTQFLKGEINIHSIYTNLPKRTYASIYGNTCTLSEYILKRKRIFHTDELCFNTLLYYKLKPRHV